MNKPAILFVCLGNICRSPLAEAAFRQCTREAGLDWRIDSAGTAGWHVGRTPDHRAVAVAGANGEDISGYQARQAVAKDFQRFTHIIAMDQNNLRDLKPLAPRSGGAQLRLLMDYVPGREGQDVADPYYGDASGFDLTWAEVRQGAQGLLAHLQGVA